MFILKKGKKERKEPTGNFISFSLKTIATRIMQLYKLETIPKLPSRTNQYENILMFYYPPYSAETIETCG